MARNDVIDRAIDATPLPVSLADSFLDVDERERAPFAGRPQRPRKRSAIRDDHSRRASHAWSAECPGERNGKRRQ
jgi:hypothetical protein